MREAHSFPPKGEPRSLGTRGESRGATSCDVGTTRDRSPGATVPARGCRRVGCSRTASTHSVGRIRRSGMRSTCGPSHDWTTKRRSGALALPWLPPSSRSSSRDRPYARATQAALPPARVPPACPPASLLCPPPRPAAPLRAVFCARVCENVHCRRRRCRRPRIIFRSSRRGGGGGRRGESGGRSS